MKGFRNALELLGIAKLQEINEENRHYDELANQYELETKLENGAY